MKDRAYLNQRTGIGATVGDGDTAPPATRLAASRITRAHTAGHTGGTGETVLSFCSIPPMELIVTNSGFHRRRRSSQGSTYELVDSEAQWREIQERQGLQQSQTATVRPAASSTPVQQQPVQQATVRKATTNAVNVSSSSANDSLLDQSQSDLTTVETNSQVSSSRHRHHRKHNHRHHHKHR